MRRQNLNEICSIDDCQRHPVTRGWCSAHYQRWWKHGDPVGGTTDQGAAKSALAELLRIETDECILWPYSKRHGYGRIELDGVQCAVHVIACERRHGQRPEGQMVCHSCDVPACMNYRHLRWGTAKENSADMVQRGRSAEQRKAARLAAPHAAESAIEDVALSAALIAVGESVPNLPGAGDDPPFVTTPTANDPDQAGS